MEARGKPLPPLQQAINVNLLHPQREKATQTQQGLVLGSSVREITHSRQPRSKCGRQSDGSGPFLLT